MPSGVYVDVLIANADDVVAPVDPADNGKVLARNSSTGKYEHVAMGGGTSDHAALSHLDYASAGHTGFAGTDAANTFTQKQQFQSADFRPTLDSELLTNAAFDADLSDWTAGSGWTWNNGAATHTPGSASDLTQSIALSNGELYFIEFTMSGYTSGALIVTLSGIADINIAPNLDGLYYNAGICTSGGAQTLTLSADSDFDGSIGYISVKRIADSIPSALQVLNTDGATDFEVRAGGSFGGNRLQNMFVGLNAGGVNIDGHDNVVTGNNSLSLAPHAYDNTLFGSRVLGSGYANNGVVAMGRSALEYSTGSQITALGTRVGQFATGNGGVYIGYEVAQSESADNKLHIGNNGTLSLVEGTMASDAATQTLQIHAATIVFADLPTTYDGGNPNRIWKNSGFLSIGDIGSPGGGGSIVDANDNVVAGTGAFAANTTGNNNVIFGTNAMAANDIGSENVALGDYTLEHNTGGNSNVALGSYALNTNTTGSSNYAAGFNALYSNTIGAGNFALGEQALYANVDGQRNAGIGQNSLFDNVSGNDNIGLGTYAGGGNAAINNAIFIGNGAGYGVGYDNCFMVAGNDTTLLIEGKTDLDPANQVLKINAATINFSYLPTDPTGLNPGDLWNDAGTLKIA